MTVQAVPGSIYGRHRATGWKRARGASPVPRPRALQAQGDGPRPHRGAGRATPTASELSLGGLVKHVALTERSWTGNILRREPELDFPAYADTFRLTDDETLEAVIGLYDEVAAETTEVIAGIDDLGYPVPVPPAPWNPKDVSEWSVRWVLLHMIEETARHAGHADIIRETIDGATFYPLLAASEGWPETEWLRPWKVGARVERVR
ncbi:MAG: DinB family protein [Nocardioidaceae bacterium]